MQKIEIAWGPCEVWLAHKSWAETQEKLTVVKVWKDIGSGLVILDLWS